MFYLFIIFRALIDILILLPSYSPKLGVTGSIIMNVNKNIVFQRDGRAKNIIIMVSLEKIFPPYSEAVTIFFKVQVDKSFCKIFRIKKTCLLSFFLEVRFEQDTRTKISFNQQVFEGRLIFAFLALKFQFQQIRNEFKNKFGGRPHPLLSSILAHKNFQLLFVFSALMVWR